jgi:hypothetical protein
MILHLGEVGEIEKVYRVDRVPAYWAHIKTGCSKLFVGNCAYEKAFNYINEETRKRRNQSLAHETF